MLFYIYLLAVIVSRMKNYDMIEAIGRFILREREPGKPYILKEKRDDKEFIRQAEKNYQNAVAKGKVKLRTKRVHLMVDSFGSTYIIIMNDRIPTIQVLRYDLILY
jgi:hypothetical protein